MSGQCAYVIQSKESLNRQQAHMKVKDGHPWGEYIHTNKTSLADSFAFTRHCKGILFSYVQIVIDYY